MANNSNVQTAMKLGVQSKVVEEKIQADLEKVFEKVTHSSTEIYSEKLHNTDVRCMGNFGILDMSVCSILLSTIPTDRYGNKSRGGPSSNAYNIARNGAEWLSKHDVAIAVPGFRDVDMPAVNSALKAGGYVVALIPHGINQVYKEVLKRHIESGHLLIVSNSLDDNHEWRGSKHEVRNLLLAKSSDCLLVPHLDTTWYNNTRSWSGGVSNTIMAAINNNVPVWFPQWKLGDELAVLAFLREYPDVCQELADHSDLNRVLDVMFDFSS